MREPIQEIDILDISGASFLSVLLKRRQFNKKKKAHARSHGKTNADLTSRVIVKSTDYCENTSPIV